MPLTNAEKCARYRATPKYTRAQAKYNAKRRPRDKAKGKTKARSLARWAMLTGQIRRPKECENCGRSCNPYAHHDDYTKPLAIRWLCQTCDRAAHQEEPNGSPQAP